MATRHEKVVLSLEDNFTTGMARAAAATALLDKNLSSLSGDAVKSTRIELDKTAASADKVSTEIDKTGVSARRSGAEIDRMSGRLRLLTDAALTIGPALIPIGAAAVPALFGMAAGLGAAAGATGVAVLAFSGMGDALEALNDYQLQPTEAHLEKMREQMDKLGPSAAQFVRYLDTIGPELSALRETARAGLFPGVEAGIESLLTMLPQVRVVLFNLSTALGGLAASAGAALSGEGMAAFFDYLENQAGPLLTSFGHTLGNVTQGFASLIVAFAPLTGSFASGMERMSASFAAWAAGVSQTQGFQDFVAYIQRTGPQVVELLGAIGTAFIGVVTAAAPVGEALLPVLTALARVFGAIAASPIGPPLFTAAAALIALNRAATLAAAGFDKLKVSSTGATTAAAKFGAGVSFAAILMGIGAVNSAFNSLSSTIDETDLTRNLEALSNGEAVDNLSKLSDWISQATSSWVAIGDKFSDVVSLGFDTSALEKAQEEIEKVDQVLAQMVESGQGETAAKAFDQIAAAAERQGVSLSDVEGEFDSYETALRNAGSSTDEAAAGADAADAAMRRLAEGNYEATTSAGATRTEINALVTAMEDQRSAALGAFDAVTQYGEALTAARAAAAKGKRGLNETTEAGRENRAALSALAGAWNNQSAVVRDNVGKFREARSEFIAVATAMTGSREKAVALARALMEIPRQRVIDIQLMNIDQSSADLRRIKSEVESIPRRWQTDYYVNQINTISRRYDPAIAPEIQRAEGGTVPGPRHPYGDKVLAYLAPGEEVITNRRGEADRFRADRSAGRIPAYANGGTAGREVRMPTARPASQSISVSSASLAGLRIEGRVDVDGREGYLRGVIREEISAERRFDRVRAGG